ncbi:MAG: UbiA family prenyltransferase [Candidatus Micrarchaeota archaeon]|nr:UbiA family prenyltransferase [Candidatus Micrarchaeota archaeon]
MNRLLAVARLTRIEHSIMLAIAVITGELVAGGIPDMQRLILSLVTPIFISMGSFAINDYYDVATDKANRRFDRPIVAGAISKRSALTMSVLFFVIGVLASLPLGYAPFMIALAFAALAWLYSYRLKEILLVGNVYIALSMVIPFIYGNAVVSASLDMVVVLISVTIFLSGLAREIHGMIRDFEGDTSVRKIKNLPYYVGARWSGIVAFLLYIEAIAFSVFIFAYRVPYAHNLVYIAPIAIIDVILLYNSFIYLGQKATRKLYLLSRNISLGSMAAALIVFLVSAVLYIPI